jgi:hypothetical protein
MVGWGIFLLSLMLLGVQCLFRIAGSLKWIISYTHCLSVQIWELGEFYKDSPYVWNKPHDKEDMYMFTPLDFRSFSDAIFQLKLFRNSFDFATYNRISCRIQNLAGTFHVLLNS